MRLRDLDACFLKLEDPAGKIYQRVDALAEADGVMFQCPKCAQGKPQGEYDGRRHVVGAHYVICWFRGKVPDTLDPKPGRWTPSGSGLDDLTFVPGNPAMAISVLLTAGCGAHFFIQNGEINGN